MSLIPIHVVPGSTSVSIWVHISNQSDGGTKTDMRDATGLVTTDLTAKYCRTGGTEQTITLSALGALNSAYSSGGFFEAAEGWYRLDLPDAAVAASARQCFVRLSGNVSSQHVSGHLNINLDGGVNVTALNSKRTDGNNAVLKLAGMDITQAAGGGDAVVIKGGNASGATPAGIGLRATGGNASTTGGGLSAPGVYLVGGDSAASTNGAGNGLSIISGAVNGWSGASGLLVNGTGAFSGAKFVGGAAVGSTAAGNGVDMIGGTATTTVGGIAGVGFSALGGTGAASQNGPGLGGGFYGGTVTSGFGASAGLRAEGKNGGEGFQCAGSNTIAFGAANAGILMTTPNGSGVRIISAGHCFELDPAANFHGFNFAVSGTGHPLAPNTIDSQAVASGTITSATFASGAITSAAYAANAITSTVVADNTITKNKLHDDTGLKALLYGTASAGGASTITIATHATAQYWRFKAIKLISGTGAGQDAWIIDYNNSTGVATVLASGNGGTWLVNPDATTTYAVKDALPYWAGASVLP